jgi:N-acetylglutamate synthase-like GNAT family acetyltransferase
MKNGIHMSHCEGRSNLWVEGIKTTKMVTQEFTVKAASKAGMEWIKELYIQNWGGDICVSRGKVQKIDDFTGGFVAESAGQNVGFVTYTVTVTELEITGLVSLKEKKGIGSALVKTIVDLAKKQKLKKVALVTTNDNLNGIGFWQKRGFNLVRVYPDAM